MEQTAKGRLPLHADLVADLDRLRAVVLDWLKLIVYPITGVARLYHLTADPDELTDLAARPEHAAVRTKLFQQLVALQQQLGDKLDLRSTFSF